MNFQHTNGQIKVLPVALLLLAFNLCLSIVFDVGYYCLVYSQAIKLSVMADGGIMITVTIISIIAFGYWFERKWPAVLTKPAIAKVAVTFCVMTAAIIITVIGIQLATADQALPVSSLMRAMAETIGRLGIVLIGGYGLIKYCLQQGVRLRLQKQQIKRGGEYPAS